MPGIRRSPNLAMRERLAKITRGKTPELNAIRYSRATVNPQKAAVWLEAQVSNRTISDAHVERLARDMVAGRWQLNGETIKFNPDGVLIDGQHRLWAVINADISIVLDIAEGVPNEAMLTIDTARVRQFSDHLRIKGNLYTTQVASAARWWYSYERMGETGLSMSAGAVRATHVELEGVLARHPDLFECAKDVQNSRASRVASAGTLIFIYSGAKKKSPEKAHRWLEQIGSGVGLSANSPVHRLREKLLHMKKSRVRSSQEETCAFVMKSWLAFEQGKSVTVLRWSPEEPFPHFNQRLRKR